MTMRIAIAALGALVLASAATPASANFKFTRPDNWQCAYGYGSVWHYGDTVQWKPDARSTALRSCRSRSPICNFLGCFRRQ
jgi:hypothetical protein